MKKKKVISTKNLPARFPIGTTALAFIFLDKYNAPGWAWGVSFTLLGMIWIVVVITKVYEQPTDVLK